MPQKRPGGKNPRKSSPPKSRAKSTKSPRGEEGRPATERPLSALNRDETTPAGGVLAPTATTGGGTAPPEGQICYPLRYPDRYDDVGLAGEIAIRIAGRPADGSLAPTGPRTGRLQKVIWVDAGDTVLVHLDSTRVKLLDQTIVASIDVECDQTGLVTMVGVFVTGNGSDPAGLVCVTDETPRGNGLMAARWGPQIQAALWSALLGLVGDHAKERNLAPLGFIASPGALQLFAGQSIAISAAAAGGTDVVK